MTYIEWTQLLLPIGFAIRGGWLIAMQWKELNRWLDRPIELL